MDHQLPVGTAISFTYNAANYTAGMTSGMLMGDLRFQTLTFDAFRLRTAMMEKNEVPYIMARAGAFITPKTVNATLCERATLGTLVDGQVTVAGSADINGYVITWLDETGAVTSTVTLGKTACRGAYTILPYTAEHWLVNGKPFNAGDKVPLTGDTEIRPSTEEVNANTVSLRLNGSGEDSGIRFTTAVSKELYQKLVAAYGKENVHLKTAIAPADYFAAAESATLEGLEALMWQWKQPDFTPKARPSLCLPGLWWTSGTRIWHSAGLATWKWKPKTGSSVSTVLPQVPITPSPTWRRQNLPTWWAPAMRFTATR